MQNGSLKLIKTSYFFLAMLVRISSDPYKTKPMDKPKTTELCRLGLQIKWKTCLEFDHPSRNSVLKDEDGADKFRSTMITAYIANIGLWPKGSYCSKAIQFRMKTSCQYISLNECNKCDRTVLYSNTDRGTCSCMSL